MPFKRLASGNYVSPSGRKWTPAQVKLYYATDGFSHEPKPKKVMTNKHAKVVKALSKESANVR